MFKHILIPLDGSQTAERVLQRLAPLFGPGAIRHLVTVVPAGAGREPSPADRVRWLEAESYLSFLAADLGAGVRAEVRRGEVLEEILGASGALGVELIALSSHGESARPDMPCGSVAGRVLLAATCPVLVIGAFGDDAGHTPGRPTRILVALDGSSESEASLPPARSAAAEWGAEIILLHVIEPLWAAADSAVADWRAKETEATQRRLRELADGLGREGIRARVLLSHGEPAREIVAQVMRRQAGLLCLSTAGRGAMGRLLFGAVAQKLIGALPVPILIVRAAPSRPV
jgi:nucleotide-binding universal stress UspA family protein